MKKFAKISLFTLLIMAVALIASSLFFMRVALYNDAKFNENEQFEKIVNRYPHIEQWIDSIRPLLCDTTIISATGQRLFARYAPANKPSDNTAIIIHGYKSNSVAMMHIGYMFHHDFGYNILLPDLQSHGYSEGEYIQMGWKDKDDVRQWIDVAMQEFGDSTRIVITGISMGGATTMMVSGENLPSNVKCFVEDCGYTSVWDEFRGELRNQYYLPAFPLLNITSGLCNLTLGWSFSEASSLEQVKKCQLPMMFIHGGNDTYVPTEMVYPLYEAKADPKEIYISKGSAHAVSYKDNPEAYTQRVRAFVAKYCR